MKVKKLAKFSAIILAFCFVAFAFLKFNSIVENWEIYLSQMKTYLVIVILVTFSAFFFRIKTWVDGT